MEDVNQEKNRRFYNRLYENYPIKNILYWVNNLDVFLKNATTTETSWFGIYQKDFRIRINGKKVLEMGCGDCTNAAIMAALGAEVYANDIASTSGEIISRLNDNLHFKFPIQFIEGDLLKNNLPSENFDFIIGKAFLHHLTIPVEKLFLKETARLLKPGGEARFFEPAVNNKFLDYLRWHVPVKGRPTKFNKRAFEIWKKNDPHPDRSFSSNHFEKVGKDFFTSTEILPIGMIERFHKFLLNTKYNNDFRRWALRVEQKLPQALNRSFARSQLIIYQKR